MNIKLDYILRRNKSNLKIFISKNRLTSYEQLLEYCNTRKFIPCTEADYNLVVGVTPKLESKNEAKVSRKASKAQEPKKRRYRRKKQQDTSKLPDSTD